MRFVLLFSFLISSQALSSDWAKRCAEKVWAKRGILRKYQPKYMASGVVSTHTSAKENFSVVSKEFLTQSSTAYMDPGISTGKTISTPQFLSSFGDCSLFAENGDWLRREYYVAENFINLRNDIAKEDGEYLDSFMFLTGCPANVKDHFSKFMHQNYLNLFSKSKEYWEFSSDVDQLIQTQALLATTCKVFPTGV